MALVDALARSASVVAKETTEIVSLDQPDFHKEVERNPAIAFELLTVLSHRVRALEKIIMNSLGGLVPICMHCKNIRDESESWVRLEEYITDRSEAEFSHGICPDCLRKLYPNISLKTARSAEAGFHNAHSVVHTTKSSWNSKIRPLCKI